MDNVKKFLEQYGRMCKSFDIRVGNCDGCELNNHVCNPDDKNFSPEKMIEAVIKWSKENPEIKVMSFVEAIKLPDSYVIKPKMKPFNLFASEFNFFSSESWISNLTNYAHFNRKQLIESEWEVKEI